MKHRWFFLILLQSIIYGIGDPISKLMYQEVTVSACLSLRFTIAAVILLAFYHKKLWADLRKTPILHWLPAAACMALCYLCSNEALTFTMAAHVAFLRSSSAVWTPLILLIFFRKRCTRPQIIALGLMLVGLYLLCGGLSSFGIGELWGLVSAILAALSLIFGAQALEEMHPLSLTTMQVVVAAVLNWIMTFAREDPAVLLHAFPASYLVILYLAIPCSLIGYALQNQALTLTGADIVSLAQCTYPIMTALFSFLILGEAFSLQSILGALLILLSILLATRYAQHSTPQPAVAGSKAGS